MLLSFVILSDWHQPSINTALSPAWVLLRRVMYYIQEVYQCTFCTLNQGLGHVLSNALTYCPITMWSCFINSLLKERDRKLLVPPSAWCKAVYHRKKKRDGRQSRSSQDLATFLKFLCVCRRVYRLVIGGSLWRCHGVLWKFVAYLATPIRMQEAVEVNTEGGRRFPEGATLEPGASSVPRWQKSGRSRGNTAKPH